MNTESRTKKKNGYTTLNKEEKTLYHSARVSEYRERKRLKELGLNSLNLVHLSSYELMMGVQLKSTI
jgi:hypothetical protein